MDKSELIIYLNVEKTA